MSLQDWGALGEIVGGIAVVASLIYLSFQLRQASKALKTSTADTGTTHNASVWQTMLADPELLEIMMKGGNDPEALSDLEYTRFTLAINMQMRFFEHQFLLDEEGAISPGFWAGMKRGIAEVIGPPGSRQAWDQQQHVFSTEFVELVSALPVSAPQMTERNLLDRPSTE